MTEIERIIVDYHRMTKITPKQIPKSVTWDHVTWEYWERLVIDRATNSLEHIQVIGSGCKISHKYEVEGGIESLLDNLGLEELFEVAIGDPDEMFTDPNETRDYTITVDYKTKPQRIISGSFDKHGLPTDYAEFAETVFDFIHVYGLGEILAPAVYCKARRTRNDYIFCSVEFDKGGKSYYYLTEDETFEVGDLVLVPVGNNDRTVVVEIVDIQYFTEDDAPMPLDRVKSIIERYVSDIEYRNTAVLSREPLPDCTPDTIRIWLKEHCGECNLAKAFAVAHNQTGWLMHDLDENDDAITRKKYESWWELESELCQRIIDILIIEDPEGTVQRKSGDKGTHHVITPFMIRNGFSDGSGWWIGDYADLFVE